MALLSDIEDDAFNTLAFRHLYGLTMTNLAIHSLGPNSLRGLDNLETLELRSSIIIHFPPILPLLANTLYFFQISANDVSRSRTQSIDHLSNGVPMLKVTYLKFHLNLQDSLSNQTFVSFVSIVYLDISNSRIQYLIADTFYPIRNTIHYIDLSGNLLKTLPLGMLTYLLTKSTFDINLDNNPFYCDCHLLELQRAIIQYTNTFNYNMYCQEPEEIAKIPIQIATFCGQPDGLSPSHLIKSMQCRIPNYIAFSYSGFSMKILKKRSKTFGIHRIDDDSLNLTVSDEYQPSRIVYVLYGADSLRGLRSFREIPILEHHLILIHSRMKPNRLQMICVKGIDLSATDCATIWSTKEEHNHLLKSQLVYFIIVLIVLLCLAVGTFFGYISASKNIFRICGQKKTAW